MIETLIRAIWRLDCDAGCGNGCAIVVLLRRFVAFMSTAEMEKNVASLKHLLARALVCPSNANSWAGCGLLKVKNGATVGDNLLLLFSGYRGQYPYWADCLSHNHALVELLAVCSFSTQFLAAMPTKFNLDHKVLGFRCSDNHHGIHSNKFSFPCYVRHRPAGIGAAQKIILHSIYSASV